MPRYRELFFVFWVLALAALTPLGAGSARATADGPDHLRVIGVQRGDVLWIRAGPSANHRKVGSVPFDGRGINNLGCRSFGQSFWCQVKYRGVVGWSNGRYLGED